MILSIINTFRCNSLGCFLSSIWSYVNFRYWLYSFRAIKNINLTKKVQRNYFINKYFFVFILTPSIFTSSFFLPCSYLSLIMIFVNPPPNVAINPPNVASSVLIFRVFLLLILFSLVFEFFSICKFIEWFSQHE